MSAPLSGLQVRPESGDPETMADRAPRGSSGKLAGVGAAIVNCVMPAGGAGGFRRRPSGAGSAPRNRFEVPVSPDAARKILRIAIIAFALEVAYPYIPSSESAEFKGVSLFLGVIFSLGSSSIIANTMAGYALIYRRACTLGDRVKINDMMGDVVEMRLQVMHVRSLKNEEVIVPNSLILNSQVINYSSLARKQGLILHTLVGIGYEVPWRQVEAMLLMAADRTPGLRREPRPYILQQSLGDFAVNYELNVYCDDASAMMQLYTALHRNILDVHNGTACRS